MHSSPTPTKRRGWQMARLALAAASLPCVLVAQTAAPAASSAGAAADIVELNPFVVDASRNTGYVASETLSGTRLKTEVRHVASPVTILTEEFLQDIGATNFADIVEFMPGTETYRFDDSDTIANEFDTTNVEVGGQRFGNREWSSNLVTRYAFREGWLKGWNVGGSVRWRDKALVGYAVNRTTRLRDPNRPFFERDYWTMDAFVGHTRKILRDRVTWDTNLRVRDFNHSRVWTTVAAAVDAEGYSGAAFPTRRVVMAPISVQFNSSFQW